MKAWRGQLLAQGHPAGKWQVLHLHPGVVALVPVSCGMRGVSSCVKELGMLEGWGERPVAGAEATGRGSVGSP